MTTATAKLPVPKGIDSLPSAQIPETWSRDWFIRFLTVWLRAADVRNATAIFPLTITGNGTTPATLSISGVTSGINATIQIPKLTPGGVQGSMTFTNGILTAFTQAT